MNCCRCPSLPGLQGTVLIICLAYAGCHGADHEEAEHHTPAHRPPDYPAAVKRLLALHREIMDGTVERGATDLDVFQELYDVVRWIPELAADSDLPREPWERIRQTSYLLTLELNEVRIAASDARRECYRSLEPSIDRKLTDLSDLARRHALEFSDGVETTASEQAPDDQPETPSLPFMNTSSSSAAIEAGVMP
ncbi:MAG: hypothetical protein AB7F89_22040 [Pirellulaceae bacterium]